VKSDWGNNYKPSTLEIKHKIQELKKELAELEKMV
jgi:hypothetical protein